MTPSVDPRALMIVAIGSRRVAVHGGEVSEVAKVSVVTPVPCDDPAILGVTLHRGRIVTEQYRNVILFERSDKSH